jgi:hypothetical protein
MNRAGTVLVALGAALSVVLALGGCAATRDEGSPAPLLRGQWLLVDARDQAGRIDLMHQYLTLSVATDSSTNGRASCSDYTASILGDPRSLWVRAALPSQINCGTSLQQTLEDRYIGDLNTIRSASIERDGLHLMSAGVDLHFKRVLPQSLADVQDRVWYTGVVQALNLDTNSPSYSLPEPGASLKLASGGLLTATTPCGTISAHYREDSGLVVADRVVVKIAPKCSEDGQLLDDYLVKLIDSGFTVTSSFHTMVVTSQRALLRVTFSQAEFN